MAAPGRGSSTAGGEGVEQQIYVINDNPLRLPFGRHLPQGELTEGQERVAWAIAQWRLIQEVSRIYLLIQGF